VTLGDYDQVITEGDEHAMTRDDDARVADLVARLGDADAPDLFRRLVESSPSPISRSHHLASDTTL